MSISDFMFSKGTAYRINNELINKLAAEDKKRELEKKLNVDLVKNYVNYIHNYTLLIEIKDTLNTSVLNTSVVSDQNIVFNDTSVLTKKYDRDKR